MSDSSNGEHSGEADTGGTVNSDTSETSPSAGRNLAYSAVIIAVAGIGVLAVVAGVGGTLFALMGGPDAEGSDILGEYDCEEFDGDPGVVHDADYEVEREVRSPSELATFNGTLTETGVTISLETKGPLLAASATDLDGVPFDVDTDENHVRLERNTTDPFRLWVDSVAEDGTVTRSQLDICPPQ